MIMIGQRPGSLCSQLALPQQAGHSRMASSPRAGGRLYRAGGRKDEAHAVFASKVGRGMAAESKGEMLVVLPCSPMNRFCRSGLEQNTIIARNTRCAVVCRCQRCPVWSLSSLARRSVAPFPHDCANLSAHDQTRPDPQAVPRQLL